ncbi:MAG: VOC family protein [Microcoleaceae cyanobacterium]
MALNCQSAFVTIASLEIEPLVGFYCQLLGIQPQIYQAQAYAEFHLGGFRLGIFKPKETNADEFAHHQKTSISLCLEVENLEQAIAHLHHLGYPPSGAIITAAHGQEIYAYDPLGNRLIVHQSWHKSVW